MKEILSVLRKLAETYKQILDKIAGIQENQPTKKPLENQNIITHWSTFVFQARVTSYTLCTGVAKKPYLK